MAEITIRNIIDKKIWEEFVLAKNEAVRAVLRDGSKW